jgi:hypothetical protein
MPGLSLVDSVVPTSSCFDEVLDLICSATQVDPRSLLSRKIKVLPETFARRGMGLFDGDALPERWSLRATTQKASCSSESDLLDNRLIPHHHLHDFPIHDALDVSPANDPELIPPCLRGAQV